MPPFTFPHAQLPSLPSAGKFRSSTFSSFTFSSVSSPNKPARQRRVLTKAPTIGSDVAYRTLAGQFRPNGEALESQAEMKRTGTFDSIFSRKQLFRSRTLPVSFFSKRKRDSHVSESAVIDKTNQKRNSILDWLGWPRSKPSSEASLSGLGSKNQSQLSIKKDEPDLHSQDPDPRMSIFSNDRHDLSAENLSTVTATQTSTFHITNPDQEAAPAKKAKMEKGKLKLHWQAGNIGDMSLGRHFLPSQITTEDNLTTFIIPSSNQTSTTPARQLSFEKIDDRNGVTKQTRRGMRRAPARMTKHKEFWDGIEAIALKNEISVQKVIRQPKLWQPIAHLIPEPLQEKIKQRAEDALKRERIEEWRLRGAKIREKHPEQVEERIQRGRELFEKRKAQLTKKNKATGQKKLQKLIIPPSDSTIQDVATPFISPTALRPTLNRNGASKLTPENLAAHEAKENNLVAILTPFKDPFWNTDSSSIGSGILDYGYFSTKSSPVNSTISEGSIAPSSATSASQHSETTSNPTKSRRWFLN